jgi:nucleoside-diphosphate-sugar epimerase
MKKVMVIGAAGWLGRSLVERLIQENRQVICVDVHIPESLTQYKNTEAIEADIRDVPRFAQKLEECETVFNCCGLQHPKSTKDIYAVNAEAPTQVFIACQEAGVKTFVHISSLAAHGSNKSSTVFIDEASPLSAVTHYGKSKAQGDTALQLLHEEGKTRLIILRPGVFYGERPSKNLREFLEKLQKTTLPLFSRQGFLRTYLDIEKAIDAMLLCEHKGISGEAYLIGDTEPLSTLRFYGILADELGVPLKTLRVPLVAARLAEKAALWAGSFGVHVRLPTIVGEFGRHTFASSKKAEHKLGFMPHQSSEEGLRKMARSISQ